MMFSLVMHHSQLTVSGGSHGFSCFFCRGTRSQPLQEAWCKRHDPMTLKRYTRHRKPTGRDASVTIAEIRGPAAAAGPATEGGGSGTTGALLPLSSSAAGAASTAPTTEASTGATTTAVTTQSADVEKVLRAANPIGPGIQLRSPGFLPNARQHRMFGLATLELAQLARRHWNSVKAGTDGAVVLDTGSSAWKPLRPLSPQSGASGSAGGGTRGKGLGAHRVGYRDVFDVAVRWRQLSEPNDPVWWIDRLTTEAFSEGFGLQTPMVNGQLKVRLMQGLMVIACAAQRGGGGAHVLFALILKAKGINSF